jgi:hypothetical protein
MPPRDDWREFPLDAVHDDATVGAICNAGNAMADVFGRYCEEPVL